MTFNDKGLALLKDFEGCKLTAYQDMGGKWTIGYGSTRDVICGMTITQAEAEERLKDDISETAARVKSLVPKSLNDNQFSAVVCFAFNVKGWPITPLFHNIACGDFTSAIGRWCLYDKVSGIPEEGLLRRREAEKELFLAVP